MTHGMILYVRNEQEAERTGIGTSDFVDSVHSLEITTLCMAGSEDQIMECWWRLIRDGVHQISYVTAAYDASKDRLHSFKGPAMVLGCA